MIISQINYVRIRSCLFLLVVCLAVLLVACSFAQSNDPEVAFQSEIGVKIDPQVILATNRIRYDNSNRDIAFWVVNRKAKPVFFPDSWMGIRVYQFDSISKRWTQIKLKAQLQNHILWTVPPRGEPNYLVGVFDTDDVPNIGTVRMVVIGWDDPKNPEGSKIAAFTDVDIAGE